MDDYAFVETLHQDQTPLTFFRNSNMRLMACVITLFTFGPPVTPRWAMINATVNNQGCNELWHSHWSLRVSPPVQDGCKRCVLLWHLNGYLSHSRKEANPEGKTNSEAIMSDTELIASIDTLLPELVKCHHEIDSLKAENLSLREDLARVRDENVKLFEQVEIKNTSFNDLVSEIRSDNSQRMEFLQNMGQHFKVQADLVEAKYEVCNLLCSAHNLFRFMLDSFIMQRTSLDWNLTVQDSQFGAWHKSAKIRKRASSASESDPSRVSRNLRFIMFIVPKRWQRLFYGILKHCIWIYTTT